MRLQKIVHLFSILSLGLLISYCSTSQNYYLEPEFENEKVESSLLVIPVERSLFDGFGQHAFSVLNKNEKQIFDSNLASLLKEYSNSEVTIVHSDAELKEEDYIVDSLETPKDKFPILLPKDGIRVEYDNNSSRFVLLLDQYYFREREETAYNSSYPGSGGEESSTNKVLDFETAYVYWDNEQQEAVAWGTASAQVKSGDNIANSDYSNIFSKVLKDIVKQGPFKKNIN